MCVSERGDRDWGKPGARVYVCMNREYVVEVGKPETYDFRLRIDTVIANATGAVEVNKPCECSQFGGDTDRSDNTAALVVNPAEGGAGGGLPVTGPAVATAAAGGLLLLAGGAVGVALARRRRTRFVA